MLNSHKSYQSSRGKPNRFIRYGKLAAFIHSLILFLYLLSSPISNVSAADTELRRCVIEGKVVYKGGVCPGQVDESAREVWNQKQIEREQKLEEERRREAMRQARIERAERDAADAERQKKRANISLGDTDPVDCNNLYNYAKNVRGDNWITAGGVVANAEKTGKCKWR